MDKSRSVPASAPAEAWRTLADATRGVRRWRFGAGGRPLRARLADGRELTFAHDELGRLRRLQADDGFFLAIDPARGSSSFEVEDPGGVTSVRLARDGRSEALRRDGAELCVARDRRGRVRRVVLPGSAAPLEYVWDATGCTVGPPEGPAVLRVETAAAGARVRLTCGAGWDEVATAAGTRLVARDRAGEPIGEVAVDQDVLGRMVARRWGGATAERFTRDADGRLASCTTPDGTRQLAYGPGGDLVAEHGPAGTCTREVDAGRRVRAVTRPDGTRVTYGYDRAGQRVERNDPRAGVTRYHYDALGRLVEAQRPDGTRVRFSYDGLGRRTAVRPDGAPARLEHRDSAGRLWAVTNEAGRALHTFVWLGERCAARLDGPVGSPVAEAYLCDPGGTPLAVLRDGRLECVATPLWGLAAGLRPTLYGHTGDPETGLIHFGARDLDPELGVFLVPDPWHGGPDDPRLWSGGQPQALAASAERPASGAHPYALCQHDPVGRIDPDGHAANWLGFLRTLVLGPTWGAPLTSLSLLFFFPLDIYFELIADFLFLIAMPFGARRVPWANNHITGLIGAAGSSRQGALAFGLSGILPRFFSGGFRLSADRAVTIGNVIWINRHELEEIDHPTVLDVWDIGGPPGADGAPTGGPTAFNADPAKDSVVAVVGTEHAKKRAHVSHWTRGFGNVVAPAAAPGGEFTMQDRPKPAAAGFSRGTLHLAAPLPDGFPAPQDADAPETLAVYEYLADPATTADAELVGPVGFALHLPKNSGVATGDSLELSAPGATPAVTPAFAVVKELVHEPDGDTAFLSHDVLAAITAVTGDLTVRKVHDVTPSEQFPGWTGPAALNRLELTSPSAAPLVPPRLHKDMLVRVEATPPLPLDDAVNARVQGIAVTLKLAPTLGAVVTGTGTAVRLVRPGGGPFPGEVPDPAKPAEIKLGAGHPSVAVDDLVSVTLEGTAKTAYVRVSAIAGDVVTVDPALTPELPIAAAAKNVRLQRYVDSDTSRDMGTEQARTGDELTLEVDRAGLFQAGSLVHLEAGGTHHLRKVDAVTKVAVELSQDRRGAAPYVLVRAELVPGLRVTDARMSGQRRFLKFLPGTGTAPSGFGTYKLGTAPDTVLAVRPKRPPTFGSPPPVDGRPPEAVFYVRPDPGGPAGLDPDFRRTWKPRTVDADEFWVLDTDLPIDDSGGKLVWKLDSGAKVGLSPAQQYRVVEYKASRVSRVDGGGRRVTAHPPEVAVPVKPHVHDTHRRALLEHELHHSVQNCHWGPLMGAAPLTGIVLDIAELDAAAGNQRPPWLKTLLEEFPGQQLGWATIFSIGGVMELVWKYILLGPVNLFSVEKRKEITSTNFSDWDKIFNPFHGLLLANIDEVNPNAPSGERWKQALVKLIANAFDLRSWTPFTGFVPTLLPDGPRSFLEQQASRASGDVYSSILTADDRFNFHTHTFFVPDSTDADLTRSLGQVVRLMAFAEFRTDRLLQLDHANQPGSPLRYLNGPFKTIRWETASTPDDDVVWVALGPSFSAGGGAPGAALFHPDLFEWKSPGAHPTVTIEGPAPAREQKDFLKASPGDEVRPRLPALVPAPPRVNRSAGFYFIAATPGSYEVNTFYTPAMDYRPGAPPPTVPAQDNENLAGTHTVTLAMGGKVLLGDEEVAWSEPAGTGAPLTGLTKLQRFVTESEVLRLESQSTAGFTLDLTPPAAPALVSMAVLPDGRGWKLTAAKAFAAGAPPTRVRLYRVFAPNDAAFSLTYDAKEDSTLEGVRSYLPGNLWVPVRDFLVEVSDLPDLPDATKTVTKKSDEALELDLPLKLPGPDAITIVPRAGAPAPPPKQRTAGTPAAFPRGEKWRIGPLQPLIPDQVAYDVTVTFGTAPDTVARRFELKMDPVIRLANKDGTVTFDARKDHPLELTITGGTAPYTVENPDLPTGTSVTLTATPTVLVTVTTPPPADTDVVVTVRDSGGKRGQRTIHIRKA